QVEDVGCLVVARGEVGQDRVVGAQIVGGGAQRQEEESPTDAQVWFALRASEDSVSSVAAQPGDADVEDAVGDVVLRPQLPARVKVVAAFDADHRINVPLPLATRALADLLHGVAGSLFRLAGDGDHALATGATDPTPSLLVWRVHSFAALALDLDRHESLLAVQTAHHTIPPRPPSVIIDASTGPCTGELAGFGE